MPRINSKGGRSPRASEADEEEEALLGPGPSSSSQALQAPEQQKCCSSSRAEGGLVPADDDRTCRICFETEDPAERDVNPLISPCKCSGGSRFIHRQCLQKWRDSSLSNPRSLAFYRCEVCHFEYKFVRSDVAGVLTNKYVFTTLFVLAFMALGWLLGYIPLVQACLSAYQINLNSHAHALVHVADGLIVLGLLGIVGWIYDGCASGRGLSMCDACGHCNCTGCLFLDDCAGACSASTECGPILLVLLGIAAAVGLVVALPQAYAWLYAKAEEVQGATVRMVENVSTSDHPDPPAGNSSPPAAEAV